MAQIGEALRGERVRRGLTLEQVAQETRIAPRFLEALEAERFDDLPAPVYVRGFLRSYASYLRIDASPLLAQLPGAQAGPGPEGFVGGAPAPPRPRSSDPFRRDPPPPPRAPEPPARVAVPAPPPVYEEAGEDDGYYDEDGDVDSYASPLGARALGSADDDPYGRRGVLAGVLAERPDDGEGRGGGRALVLIGAAVLALVVVVAAIALTRSGGGGSTPAAGAGTTPTSAPGTVVAVGSQTPRPTGSASASPSGTGTRTATGTASASASATGSASATATGGPGTPTPTASTATPTATGTTAPTATPTDVPTVIASATAVTPTAPPPTPTPVPPTPPPPPSPTPVTVAYPSTYGECTATRENCGNAPFRIVCVPNGDWFVDAPYNGPFLLPSGWTAISSNQAYHDDNPCAG